MTTHSHPPTPETAVFGLLAGGRAHVGQAAEKGTVKTTARILVQVANAMDQEIPGIWNALRGGAHQRFADLFARSLEQHQAIREMFGLDTEAPLERHLQELLGIETDLEQHIRNSFFGTELHPDEFVLVFQIIPERDALQTVHQFVVSLLEAKQTSRVSRLMPDLKQLRPGEVPVHLIAMGSTECYGLNRNGDGFKRAALERALPTFEAHAWFFQDHDNRARCSSRQAVRTGPDPAPEGPMHVPPPDPRTDRVSIAPRPPAPLPSPDRVTLAELAREVVFFTVGPLVVGGRLPEDPTATYAALESDPARRPRALDLPGPPLFVGLGLVRGVDWSRRLGAVRADAWDDLRAVLSVVHVHDPKTGRWGRAVPHDVTVPDVLAVARGRAPAASPPRVPVVAFGYGGSDGTFQLADAPPARGRPVALWGLPDGWARTAAYRHRLEGAAPHDLVDLTEE